MSDASDFVLPQRARLVAIAGKKGSGKSTLARAIRDAYDFDCDGNVLADIVSLAEPIKRFCVDLLGVPAEHAYGTDADKNRPTRYRWADLPHFERILAEWHAAGARAADVARRSFEKLTVRQLLQEVGTGVFRSFDQGVFIRKAFGEFRRLAAQGSELFVVDDARFHDELSAARAAGGTLVRLLRSASQADGHASETKLDAWTDYDLVLPDQGKEETAEAAVSFLKAAGILPASPKHRQSLAAGGRQ